MPWPEGTIDYTSPLPLIEAGDWIHLGVYTPWLEVVRAYEPDEPGGRQLIVYRDPTRPHRGEEIHISGNRGYYGIARLSKGRNPRA